jgi:hypothetical protein
LWKLYYHIHAWPSSFFCQSLRLLEQNEAFKELGLVEHQLRFTSSVNLDTRQSQNDVMEQLQTLLQGWVSAGFFAEPYCKYSLLSISYYFSKRGSQVCCQLANYVSKFGSWAQVHFKVRTSIVNKCKNFIYKFIEKGIFRLGWSLDQYFTAVICA